MVGVLVPHSWDEKKCPLTGVLKGAMAMLDKRCPSIIFIVSDHGIG